MKELMDKAMNEFKGFDVVEVGIFKACMVSFGVLLGFFAGKRRCRLVLPIVFLVFLATYVFTMIKFFGGLEEEIEE